MNFLFLFFCKSFVFLFEYFLLSAGTRLRRLIFIINHFILILRWRRSSGLSAKSPQHRSDSVIITRCRTTYCQVRHLNQSQNRIIPMLCCRAWALSMIERFWQGIGCRNTRPASCLVAFVARASCNFSEVDIVRDFSRKTPWRRGRE